MPRVSVYLTDVRLTIHCRPVLITPHGIIHTNVNPQKNKIIHERSRNCNKFTLSTFKASPHVLAYSKLHCRQELPSFYEWDGAEIYHW